MSSPLMQRVALGVGLVGFVASVAAHLLSFVRPEPLGSVGVLLHLGVFVAFVPMMLGLKAWVEGEGAQGAGAMAEAAALWRFVGSLPGWQKVAIGGLFAYAFVNFGVGILAMEGDPGAGLDTRLFSGHWMLFYATSAVLARRLIHLAEASDGGL